MRIVNKAYDKSSIEFFAKDESGNDIPVKLGYHQFVFTPTDEKTRTININGRRGFIFIDFEKKPDFAEYFKPYSSSLLKRMKEVFYSTKKDEQINSEIKENFTKKPFNKDLITKKNNEYSDLEKQFEKELLDLELNNDSKKNLEDSKEEEKENTKKRKYKYKKKPGRPKKRGPKPKKKPRGRPPKNKK